VETSDYFFKGPVGRGGELNIDRKIGGGQKKKKKR